MDVFIYGFRRRVAILPVRIDRPGIREQGLLKRHGILFRESETVHGVVAYKFRGLEIFRVTHGSCKAGKQEPESVLRIYPADGVHGNWLVKCFPFKPVDARSGPGGEY